MHGADMKTKYAAGTFVDAWEYEQFEHQHRQIFGHTPVPDLAGKILCVHPLCERLQRMVSAPGVEITLPYRPQDIDRRREFLTMDEEEINPEFRH